MRVAIACGAGFVGANLTRDLRAREAQVAIRRDIDNLRGHRDVQPRVSYTEFPADLIDEAYAVSVHHDSDYTLLGGAEPHALDAACRALSTSVEDPS